MTSILHFQPQTLAVVGFYVKDNKVLLGKRLKSKMDFGLDLYAGIGGKLEQNETLDQALKREFLEEVNATPLKFEQIGKVAYNFLHKDQESKWNLLVYPYIIFEVDKEPTATDITEPVWFNKNAMPYENMWVDDFYWIHLVLKQQDFYAEVVYKDADNLDSILVRYK